MMATNGDRLKVGIGGWEHEVLDMCFYPRPGLTQTEKLRFYAEYFSTVEVRPTFWDETLGRVDARSWAEAVTGTPGFEFHVKLHASFTHRGEVRPHLVRSTRALLAELTHQGRLGSLLVQFPYAFTNTSGHRMHLLRIAEAFRGFPLEVEVRHDSWNTDGLTSFLQDAGVHLVHADMPRIRQYMPFLTGLTGNRAYVRLHGRNDKGWMFNGWDARYDYLYNGRELREIRRRVEALPDRCTNATLIWNNSTSGKSVANAFEFASLLQGGKQIHIPAATVAAFPQLHHLALAADRQASLFSEDALKQAI
jgi:uncharacterized protein YecE (DUF72 family)